MECKVMRKVKSNTITVALICVGQAWKMVSCQTCGELNIYSDEVKHIVNQCHAEECFYLLLVLDSLFQKHVMTCNTWKWS